MPFSVLISIKDYFKTKSLGEIFFHVMAPLIISCITISLQYKFTRNISIEKFDYIKVINDLISSSLTVVALFVSFSLACLTILVSSNSENITKSKQEYHNSYKIDGKKITLFQLLLIDLTYTVVIQAVVIILLFLQKFFVDYIGNNFIIVLLIIDLSLLLHVIILEIRNTNNIYLLFWKPR